MLKTQVEQRAAGELFHCQLVNCQVSQFVFYNDMQQY